MVEKTHNNFDSIVREKLKNLTPGIQPGSWEKLSQRLDAADQADAFDEKAGTRLNQIHVPYQAGSWQVLADRLALERGRILAVLHYKAMEVSLLLLLLITAWQYFPIAVPAPVKTPQPKLSYPIASTTYKENNIAINSSQTIPAKTATRQHTLPPDSVNNKQPSGIISTTRVQRSTASIFIEKEPNHRKKTNTKPLSLLPLADHLDIEVTENAHAQLREFQAEKATELNTPSDVFHQDDAIAALDGKGFALLDYGNPDELLEYIRPIERKTFLRIGFMGSPDYNRVITPSQEIENGTQISLDRYSLGYSGGISIGVEHGKWEIETGAIYSARRYQAIPTVYISGNIKDGYSALSLKNFELNTIDIPLRFRYNVFLHDKWRIYALAGISLNIVLNANYYTVDQSAFSSLNREDSYAGAANIRKPQLLRDKKLTKGLIEGGAFLKNATPYANFGIGVERYMSYHWSIFAQPTYLYALPFFNDGLGPYQDKIHSFGINMGLKVRL